MNYRLKNGIAFSIIPQILLVKWAAQNPEFIEQYYSNGLYPYISSALRWLYGWIPFSLGDVLYTLIFLLCLRYLYRNWLEIRTKPGAFVRNILVVLSVVYFTFHLLWGLNYYRQPIADKLSLNATYTKEELLQITEMLIQKTNQIHYTLARKDSAQVSFPYTRAELYSKFSNNYAPFDSGKIRLNYSPISVKGSLYSIPLTYMGYGGYLNPFTQEAQVNQKVPIFRFPVVGCHEIAHQLGYAAENEANFIGYLAALKNEDPYINYSAMAYALSYCLGELQRKDEALFKVVYNQLNRGVQKEYEALNKFWLDYENPFEPYFKSFYSSFLKAKNQAAGIASYNHVVALVVSYHKAHQL